MPSQGFEPTRSSASLPNNPALQRTGGETARHGPSVGGRRPLSLVRQTAPREDAAAVTYTNRKGATYYLRAGKTKLGVTRYYFAAKPRDVAVREVPPGFAVTESVNGVVSLARPRPAVFRENEIATVEDAVQHHPDNRNYRVAANGFHIVVYDRVDRGVEEVISDFVGMGIVSRQKATAAVESRQRKARYAPVLRFSLFDPERRTFVVERMTYRGDGGWLSIGRLSPLRRLAKNVIPSLGTDAFFELL